MYRNHSPKGTIWVRENPAQSYTIKDSDSSLILPPEIVERWSPVYSQAFKVGDWIYCDGASALDDHRLLEHRPIFKLENHIITYIGYKLKHINGKS